MLKKERDDALEKLSTLKGSLSTLEGKNKEITEVAGASSREAEKLHKEATFLRTAQEKSSEEVTCLTTETNNAEKKVIELIATLELKETELARVISES